MNVSDEKMHKVITRLYLEDRLQPAIKKYKINKRDYNVMCETLHKHYLEEDYSIDKMLDAVYNYINAHRTIPNKQYLDDILALLEDYSEDLQ